MIDHNKLASDFFDHSVRVATIVWLATNVDIPGSALERCLEDLEVAKLNKLLGTRFTQRQMTEFNNGSLGEVLSTIARGGRLGFLVEAETPIPTSFCKSGFSFSWGYYTAEWFYTDVLDEAFAERLFKWRKSVVARERAKAKKAE